MSQASITDLERVVELPDEEFTAELPAALQSIEGREDVVTLLVEHPDTFEELSARMSTLDDVGEFATEETETVERFLTVLWDGQELISRAVPAVQETVTERFTVNWECEDSPVDFHLETDPDAGTVSGGTGLLDEAELTFQGSTDVMFSMLNDDDFNGTLAFIQNRFEIIGPLQRARNLDSMMESVSDHMRDVDPDDVAL